MRHANRENVIKEILEQVVPISGRMIHGRDDGKLWEAPQAYDVHGPVSCPIAWAITNHG